MKKKRAILFQIFVWGSVLHLPLLAVALYYGYNLIYFGWLPVLYVFIFRYFNHRYFNVHWMLKYFESEISSHEQRYQKLLVWADQSEKDERKLEALQSLWGLYDFDSVKKRIQENLSLAEEKILDLQNKQEEVLGFKESTFFEYAQTHLWH